MDGIRVPVLLLQLLLVLTWVEPTSLTEDFSLSQAEALEFTINNYNNQSDEEYAFCVLETQPQPDWDPTLSEPQSLYFTIKETECKMVENLTLEQCPFKDNGQVKNCLAIIETSGEGLSVELTCEPQNPAEVRKTPGDLEEGGEGQRGRGFRNQNFRLGGFRKRAVAAYVEMQAVTKLKSPGSQLAHRQLEQNLGRGS
ncbi:cathelicidin-related peptide Pt_CRAMP1-like [Loxodonta africana]|uniref:cathelicidin-related peptide Pt_CRAMP1-like n=1 Tax=Loxodonta africana TaxID=9785 RepID=UPI0005406524|nr:cathelicidin-related peptide Pt_CRAMP1-like [Loxodonta africana]